MINVTMGLRADEAKEILTNSGYATDKFANTQHAVNDAAGLLYGATGTLGAYGGRILDVGIRCYNVLSPSCSAEFRMWPFIIGFGLGMVIPYYFLRRLDSNSFNEAKRINAVRKDVMKVIDENYSECMFHSPLQREHIVRLFELLTEDEKTKTEFRSRFNEIQALALPKEDSGLIGKIVKITSPPEAEWNTEIEAEQRLWAQLRSLLMDNADIDELVKVYSECKDKFGEKAACTFATSCITLYNLKSIYNLGEALQEPCKKYYRLHNREIRTEQFFN